MRTRCKSEALSGLLGNCINVASTIHDQLRRLASDTNNHVED